MRIADLEPGKPVKCRALVVRRELRQGGRAGHFLDVTLRDASGQVAAKVWENAGAVAEWLAVGDVVDVVGMAETYRDELQLRVDQVKPVPPGEADPSQFLPSSKKDVAQLEARLAEVAKSLRNEHLRALLLELFGDPEFARRFRTAPGAKALHHAYIGGLLEHTAEVVELCGKVCEVFPELDRDLLLAAAILHDLGKMEELSWQKAFDYTDAGHLVGHLVLGERLMCVRADRIEGFPEELKLRLSHMILSHHGSGEFGSPKLPMTAEAIALHHAEDLDAKVNMFLGQIDAARQKGQRWTERHFLLGRQLYVGDAGEPAPPESEPPEEEGRDED
jgi:3'-5' exoribonuclease